MDAYNTVTMEDILIEEVRQRPSIYDKSSAVYKNSRIRDQEWKDVAKAVNVQDVEAVKKRWRSLRDSFIKLQRSLRHNPKQVVKWLYYKRLMFLTPHIESKEPSSDANNKTDDEDNEVDVSSEFRYVPEDVAFSDASSSSQNKVDSSTTAASKKRKKMVLEEDPLLTNEQYIENYPRKRTIRSSAVEDEFLTPVKEPDADEQFLLSCLPALKRLQPRENLIARMRIQQVLFDIEFGDDQDQGRDVLRTKVEREESFSD